jgi:hypothetical protein
MAKNKNTLNHNPNQQPNINTRKPSALRRAGAVAVTALALGGGIVGVKAISGGEDSSKPQNPVEATRSQEQAQRTEFKDVDVFKDTVSELDSLRSRLSMNANDLKEKNLLGAENLKFSAEDLESNGEPIRRGVLTFSREGGESITILGTADEYDNFNGDAIALTIEGPQDGLTDPYVLTYVLTDSSYGERSTLPDGSFRYVDIRSDSPYNNSNYSANVTFIDGEEPGPDFNPGLLVNTLQSRLGTDLDNLKLYDYRGPEAQSGIPE